MWMDNPAQFIPKPDRSCHISWFRESFSLLETMLCILYGLPNCTVFKAKWVPLTHHVLTIGEYFNWAQILSVILKEAIEKYQKNPASRKPSFYLSAYVMDVLYATLLSPGIGHFPSLIDISFIHFLTIIAHVSFHFPSICCICAQNNMLLPLMF